jgi:hypothetical protein
MYNRYTVFLFKTNFYPKHFTDRTISNDLKKTWVNVDICVEDYYNSGTTLDQVKKSLNWSPYSNIINRDVKETRHTVEEIDEETFKTKIKNSTKEKDTNKSVTFSDIKSE